MMTDLIARLEAHIARADCVCVLRHDFPAILHALKAAEAAEAWVEARQTIDEQPLRWALVRAVKGEQG